MMNIPTLVNFADKSFLENHCFHNGGLETVDGTEMLRVDFRCRIAHQGARRQRLDVPRSYELPDPPIGPSADENSRRGSRACVETEAVTTVRRSVAVDSGHR